MQLLDSLIYQVRNKQGKVLAEFGSLLRARIASVDIKDGAQIVERSFIDGEWEEVVLYERSSATLPKEEARRLRVRVERDLISDVKKLRDKIEPTTETWNRRY